MIDIRSKNTYQKGKLIKITDTYVLVSFVEELETIKLSFKSFLENCWCDVETEQKIREKMQNLESGNTLPNI